MYMYGHRLPAYKESYPTRTKGAEREVRNFRDTGFKNMQWGREVRHVGETTVRSYGSHAQRGCFSLGILEFEAADKALEGESSSAYHSRAYSHDLH